MTIEISLDRNRKYLLGVSGGPDSMALLSLCVKARLQICVATVNYRLRESAERDEAIVHDYCQRYQIPCFDLYPKQTEKGNFQKWAREVRYQFYRSLMESQGCDVLLLGHHLDDSLENYLMALERGSHGWHYGIPFESEVDGMRIWRPLLKYHKKEIQAYCDAEGIPYGIDESNQTDKYTRNRIRHQRIEPADDIQIEAWLKDMEERNAELKEAYQKAESRVKDGAVSLVDYRALGRKERLELLRYLLYCDNPKASYPGAFVESSDDIAMRCQHNACIDLGEGHVLTLEYGQMRCYRKEEEFAYSYPAVSEVSTPYFSLALQGRTIEGLTLQPKDFPITVRNARQGDAIKLRSGTKKVNRMMIDKKLSKKERQRIVVVENNQGEVIFVSRIGCDVNHFSIKPSLFVVE